MHILAMDILFNPPAWPVLLRAAAAALVAVEIWMLFRWCRGDDRAALPAAGLTAIALLAGPILAIYAAVRRYSANFVPTLQPEEWRLIVAGLRGAFVSLLALAVLTAGRPGSPESLVVLTAVAMVWALRSYRRTTAEVAPRVKLGLLGLRLGVIALLFLWTAGITLRWTQEETARPVLLVGVDQSASMQNRDVPETLAPPASGRATFVSRSQGVRNALQNCDSSMISLGSRCDLQFFTFSNEPKIAGNYSLTAVEACGSADGKATAIGDSLAGAMDRYAGRNVAGVLLLSDGGNNTADLFAPERFAEILGARGVPIFAVGVGADRPSPSARSLGVNELWAPDQVEAFNVMPVRASLEAYGLKGRTVKLECKLGDQVIGSETVAVDDDVLRQPIELEHIPLAAGIHRLEMTARLEGTQPADLGGQRTASRFVHVTDRELRILYIEGKFRYEVKYVTQALAGASRFKVDRRILPASGQASSLGENLADWLPYHAIILGDVPASAFTPAQLRLMRDLVSEYGKGLCMLGGASSFGRGGWGATPVATVMPVDLFSSREQLEGPLRVEPTRAGLESDLMKIGDEKTDTAAAWKKLGSLGGANKLVGVKPSATVLAQSPAGDPLIVVATFGKGRAAAIAFDTTWQWVLTPRDTGELQRRFWRQTAMYLANPRGNAWITTDKASYDLGRLARGVEKIVMTAGVEDSKGRVLSDEPVEVTLTLPGGQKVSVAMAIDGAMRSGTLAPPTAGGVYTLELKARVEGRELTAAHKFEVVARDLENMDVLANLDLMQRIAQAGGGAYAPLHDLPALLKSIEPKLKPRTETRKNEANLSSLLSWPILVGIIALLCLEWIRRKKAGLV